MTTLHKENRLNVGWDYMNFSRSRVLNVLWLFSLSLHCYSECLDVWCAFTQHLHHWQVTIQDSSLSVVQLVWINCFTFPRQVAFQVTLSLLKSPRIFLEFWYKKCRGPNSFDYAFDPHVSSLIHLGTVRMTPTIYGIIKTFKFHGFFKSLARYRYLFILLLSSTLIL